MATSTRKKPTENTNILLVGEVSSRCPKCGKGLMFTKGTTNSKKFEVAHIYPFSPTAAEKDLLKNEIRLNEDVDHIDNLIALCFDCHNEFDNPRTIAEYREMVQLKKSIIEKNNNKKLMDDFTIEAEIVNIIDALESIASESTELSLEPKRVDQKINKSMSPLTKNRIKSNVTNYYLFVRQRLAALEMSKPASSTLICAQVKTFYLKQSTLTNNQQTIYSNVVEWIMTRTRSQSREASEIIASFFVQNCEIFDDLS
ncbi:ABC-three component system protein [Pseudomonas kilonensis]|uniref:ABC-three component system protein n=1 Tax=Pseudomonas kilonensis TaxID=132476 RepID=UPI00155DAC78|nr:ABC-three component system protein [Pseudomonas kilonensis]